MPYSSGSPEKVYLQKLPLYLTMIWPLVAKISVSFTPSNKNAGRKMAYKALIEDYHLTQEELSSRIGKSRSAIANAMRILDLPEAVLDMVAMGDISAGHARAILGLKRREDMILLANKTVELDLSCRQVEEEVKRINKLPDTPPVEEEEAALPLVDYIREMELRIQSHLSRVVKIKGTGRKKSITLFYEDNEDLDELIKTICGKDFLEET